MSVINKMLQELDRRHAQVGPPGHLRHPEVRAVAAARARQEWFWRTVAALMLIAALWTGWVVFQLRPYSLATDLAYRAAQNAQRQSAAAPAPAPAPAPAAAAATTAMLVPAKVSAAPASPAPERLAAPIETLRLALTIDTPLAPRRARAPERKVVEAAPKRQQPSASDAPARIEKRPRERSPSERAESEFRRAAQLLERGRVADAEDALRAALEADRSHRPARQTLIALHIEQGRIEHARRQLQEGLSIHPGYAAYAVALARIHVDRGEHAIALEVLDGAQAGAQGNPDYHAMRGAVLLRGARHEEAAEAYRAALNAGAQAGASWIGLGISLEGAGRDPEAAEAFRRGIETGNLSDDLRAYARQRIRQLQ